MTCKTNFLQFYQIISTSEVASNKNEEYKGTRKRNMLEINLLFQLDDSTQIHLEKAEPSDFYRLLEQ